MRLALCLALLLSYSPPCPAETLIATLSSHRVMIDSNYTGTSVAIFGAIGNDEKTVSRATEFDAVVSVRGPSQSLVIRERERVGPFWLNRGQQKFPAAPAYLAVLASRPVDDISVEQLRPRQ